MPIHNPLSPGEIINELCLEPAAYGDGGCEGSRVRSNRLMMKIRWLSGKDLEGLFAANLSSIVTGFLNHDYIEITRANVIFHC